MKTLMKTLLPCLTFTGLCFCAGVTASANDFLVVPGHSIGQTMLGPNGSAELARLPVPTAQDAGMMQLQSVWVSPASRDTLYIHGIRNAVEDALEPRNGLFLNEIRVTSGKFHTQNGISTRSTLAEVRRRFPSARSVSHASYLYDDTRHGIAFEFAQPVTPASRCIGICVIRALPHGSGDAVTSQSEVNDLLRNNRLQLK